MVFLELSRFSFFFPLIFYFYLLYKNITFQKAIHILGFYLIFSIITEYFGYFADLNFVYRYVYPIYTLIYFITISFFYFSILHTAHLKANIAGFKISLNYKNIIIVLIATFFIGNYLIQLNSEVFNLLSVSFANYIFIVFTFMYFYYNHHYSMEKRREDVAIKTAKFHSPERVIEKITLKNIYEYQWYIIGFAVYSFVTWIFFMINPFLSIEEAKIAQYINFLANIIKNLCIATGFFLLLNRRFEKNTVSSRSSIN